MQYAAPTHKCFAEQRAVFSSIYMAAGEAKTLLADRLDACVRTDKSLKVCDTQEGYPRTAQASSDAELLSSSSTLPRDVITARSVRTVKGMLAGELVARGDAGNNWVAGGLFRSYMAGGLDVRGA